MPGSHNGCSAPLVAVTNVTLSAPGLTGWVSLHVAASNLTKVPNGGASWSYVGRADDVIVTSGAQQALAIASQLCFRRGEAIGVDAETYPAALDLFRALQFEPFDSGVVYRKPKATVPAPRQESVTAAGDQGGKEKRCGEGGAAHGGKEYPCRFQGS